MKAARTRDVDDVCVHMIEQWTAGGNLPLTTNTTACERRWGDGTRTVITTVLPRAKDNGAVDMRTVGRKGKGGVVATCEH